MHARRLITAALLPVLRRVFPEAQPCDLLFFGGAYDVCSPLPAKYGLDIGADTVYNILTGVSVGGSPLLESLESRGGFLNMTLSPAAVELLAASAAGRGAGMPERFELGANADCIKAGLLHAARLAPDAGYVPGDEGARRALLLTLFADTQRSRSIALKACETTLDNNRRRPILGAGAALACACAIDAWASENTETR